MLDPLTNKEGNCGQGDIGGFGGLSMKATKLRIAFQRNLKNFWKRHVLIFWQLGSAKGWRKDWRIRINCSNTRNVRGREGKEELVCPRWRIFCNISRDGPVAGMETTVLSRSFTDNLVARSGNGQNSIVLRKKPATCLTPLRKPSN